MQSLTAHSGNGPDTRPHCNPGDSIRDMARYLQVSSDIADRIASGKLAAGDELLSVRQAARRYETTVATIGRAYRHLSLIHI